MSLSTQIPLSEAVLTTDINSSSPTSNALSDVDFDVDEDFLNSNEYYALEDWEKPFVPERP